MTNARIELAFYTCCLPDPCPSRIGETRQQRLRQRIDRGAGSYWGVPPFCPSSPSPRHGRLPIARASSDLLMTNLALPLRTTLLQEANAISSKRCAQTFCDSSCVPSRRE